MDTIEFIIAVEDGSITEDQFHENVQSFVDSNVWRSLQGYWQRQVEAWESNGLCVIS